MAYSMTWDNLENVFEDPGNMRTKPAGADNCTTPIGDPIGAAHLFENQTPGPLDDQIVNGIRFLTFYRTCAAREVNGNVANFNPVVISEISLPTGKKYIFKYNEYGEITKIFYPSGSYERFEYGQVNPIGFSALEVYQQGNRGVLKRYVSFNGTTEDQEWTYQQQSLTITTIAPDGTRTERDVFEGYGLGFGFEDPRNGRVRLDRAGGLRH
ncbi:MAG TPA: hypothetical protein VGO50_19470 [Pyrinomonadaceae bacterium]|jgi:hypothetical protein|nr:hypothetical protein [Pyrinomonadaceae bacterium]